MDRLIAHINKNEARYGVRVQYSTLSEYFKELQHGVEFPVFEGDFFPYADNEDSYWTGYYTTRPQLKEKSRKLQHLLRAAEMLYTIVRGSPAPNLDTARTPLPLAFWENKFKDIDRARFETALFLHHDAITGTSRYASFAMLIQPSLSTVTARY